MPALAFNAEQWAKAHDTRDEERFDDVKIGLRNIWVVLGFVGVTFVALSGWSLNNQYEAMRRTELHAQQQLDAIHTVSGQVSTVQQTAVPNATR